MDEQVDGSGQARRVEEPPVSAVAGRVTRRTTDLGQGWVGIAANAASGVGDSRRRVEGLIAELKRKDLATRVAWTPERRTELVGEAAADPSCRCLVAAGGDGTVAALVNERPKVPISVLPSGTENLFARHFHFSKNPVRLAETIARGRVVPLDLGLTGARRFTLMAGLGFDADVVTRHHLARLGRAGVPRPTHRGAYVEPVLRSSFTYRFPPMSVTLGDGPRTETLVGTTVFVFNLPSYALGLPFAPAARGDDGLLDLVVFRNAGALQALHYLWLVLRGLHLDRDDVFHRRVRRAVVSSEVDIPVQLDGDPGGYVPAAANGWSVEVLPHAIDVLLPLAG